MLKVVIIFALAIICNASANISMKVGMLKVERGGTIVQTVLGAVVQPYVWMGVVLFAMALAFYSVVLSEINLSIAYPLMVSLGLIIVIGASYFFLTETISISQIIGFVLIITGVWLVAR